LRRRAFSRRLGRRENATHKQGKNQKRTKGKIGHGEA
jgi:hypothetical protein